ncbi:hypothetical protein BKN38_09065 [Helicobacter sp. CLO-3]|nr:hypothetical protein BA723_07630 [Helicobacter sp. CLO-3]OHU81417.1 hypothetical protein BKN38_09065 [Helicobacter sp. CLO-3]
MRVIKRAEKIKNASKMTAPKMHAHSMLDKTSMQDKINTQDETRIAKMPNIATIAKTAAQIVISATQITKTANATRIQKIVNIAKITRISEIAQTITNIKASISSSTKAAALCLVATFSVSGAFESIDEALKNGVSKGDVILYGNFMTSPKGGATQIADNTLGLANYSYLAGLGYLVGNVGLSYTSGFYKNFRAAIGFRALAKLYDAHRDLATPTGRGDSRADFFNENQAAVAESFIEYFDGDTSIKAGRIAIANDWINTLGDGIWARNRSLENIILEAFWAHDFGRIDYYQMTKFYKPNMAGLYNVGVKYYILNDALTAKAYAYFAPPIFTAIGGRIDGKVSFLDFELKGHAGYAYSLEHLNTLNTINITNTHQNANALYAQISFSRPNVFDIVAGYIHTGKESGWGSLGIMGNSIDPFFVWGGKVVKTQPNVNLVYGQVSTRVDRFNFLIAYGASFYDYVAGTTRTAAKQNELNVAMEIGFTRNVIGVINVLNTHLDSLGVPTLAQVNGGFRLSF